MKVSRTPVIRTALRPSVRQPRCRPAQTRLISTEPQGPVGDKGTAKVYNKDGTDPNKNLMYVAQAGKGEDG